jgi:hypothetical protein
VRYSLWLSVLIVEKSPPRDPRDPPYHPWRGLVHTNHTRCAESRHGCIQRISGPPSDPEIRHEALAAVPAANLGPGAGPIHPRGVRTEYNRRLAHRRPPGGAAAPAHVCVCGGGGGKASRGKAGEGRGGLYEQLVRQFPRFTPVPTAAIGCA